MIIKNHLSAFHLDNLRTVRKFAKVRQHYFIHFIDLNFEQFQRNCRSMPILLKINHLKRFGGWGGRGYKTFLYVVVVVWKLEFIFFLKIEPTAFHSDFFFEDFNNDYCYENCFKSDDGQKVSINFCSLLKV